MKEVINVVILQDGSVEVAPSGFKGRKCSEATKFLEEALGLDTKNRKFTPEYNASETVKLEQKA